MRLKTQPSSMQIKTEAPEVKIEIDPPRVELDAEEPLAEIGLKSLLRHTSDWVAEGRRAATLRIGEVAREGDRMAQTEKYGGRGAVIAQSAAAPPDQREYNVALIPTSPVKVSARGGIDISLDFGRIDYRYRPAKVHMDPLLGTVDVELAQKPELTIEVIGAHVSTWA